MTPSSTTSEVGGHVTFTGTVLPDKAGHVIYLQRLGADGDWHNEEIRFVTNASTFQFGWTFGKAGHVPVPRPDHRRSRQRGRCLGAGDHPGLADDRPRRRCRRPRKAGDAPDSRGGPRRRPRSGSVPAPWTSSSPTSSAWSARRRVLSPTTRSSSARARTIATSISTSSWSRRSRHRATSGRSCRASTAAPELDYLTYGLIVEEIGRGDSAMRTVVSVQTSLVCSALLRWGTEEQKQQLPAEAVLGRVARLLRPDRARHRIGRRQPAHPREEDRLGLGHQRRQDVHLDRQPRQARARVRPDRPRARLTADWPASWSRPTSPATSRRRCTTSSACAARTPPRSR